MKIFEKICKMTQPEVKKYMEAFLTENNYSIANEDGFLYAIPNKDVIPVLLVAHMDTVHKEQCKEIINEKGKLSSPQGIGGDDRCGIYMIMNIVKELHCSVLLTEDEEIGGVGASKFASSKYIDKLDINYMIEFDRRGNNDAVFYSCGNKEFISFIEEVTGLKEAFGSYSDISTIMPASKIAGVNFSCGYYNPHTVTEYVMFDEMINIIDIAKILIENHCDKSYEYVEKVWPKTDFANYHQYSFYDNDVRKSSNVYSLDLELELEVVWMNDKGKEKVDLYYGKTKAECWFNFFMNNPDACMDMVVDYNWC